MDEDEQGQGPLNLAGMVLDAAYRAAGGLAGPNLQSAVIPINEDWLAVAWFDAEGSPTDIVGLALLPARSPIPEGGITSALLDDVKLTALREDFVARQILMALVGQTVKDEAAGLSTEDAIRKAAASRPTRDELSAMTRKLRPDRRKKLDKDDELRDVAVRYLLAQREDPRRVLLEMEYGYSRDGIKGMTYPKIRNLVSGARAAGWLTAEGQGKRGSTDAGWKLKQWQASQEGEES